MFPPAVSAFVCLDLLPGADSVFSARLNRSPIPLFGALALANANGCIVFCTPAFAGLLGKSVSLLMGRGVSELFPAAALEGQAFTVQAQRCELQRFEVRHPDGSMDHQVFILSAAPEKSGAGRAVTLGDIPRITHDLNNVFTVLYTAIELVREAGQSSRLLEEVADQAEQGARRGISLVARIREAVGREGILVSKVVCDAAAPGVAPPERSTILVLSSANHVRLRLRAVLEYRGFKIIESVCLQEARRSLEGQDIAATIVDVDATPDWRSLNLPMQSILLISANPIAETEACWIQKPFENHCVISRLSSLLEAGRPQE